MPVSAASAASAAREPRAPGRPVRALIVTAILLLACGVVVRGGFAADNGRVITIGESNSPEQKQELLDFFGATGDDEVVIVSVADTQAAVAGILATEITSAYSSTILTCRPLGDGLEVSTRNIDQIPAVTPGLYAMALVTAGIGDAELVVAAPDSAHSKGLTALTGVFQSWDAEPCESGSTSKVRQRLALEELTLTFQIGEGFQAAGFLDGVQQATDIVLQSQQTVVTEGLKTQADIEAAITAQESTQGLAIPPDQKAKLVDLMVRLAAEEIDWSTFAAGWTIAQNETNTQITMTGDGIAIRNARASATAEAAANMTATAQANAAAIAAAKANAALTRTAEAGALQTATAGAGAALTATAQSAANMTATAQARAASAQQTAEAAAHLTATAAAEAAARATQQAVAALTATALAQPTATPVPTATPTPAPFALTGKVVKNADGALTIDPPGDATPAPWNVAGAAAITRGGKAADLAKLGEGDAVQATVNGNTRQITLIDATPAPPGFGDRIFKFWPILLGLVVPAAWWARGRQQPDPFIVKRAA